MHKKYFINTPSNKLPNNFTTGILSDFDATIFHKSINNYKSTPLISLTQLSEKYNVANIYVKDESYRFGLNAFKALGASYAIHQSLIKNPETEVFCTATDGNHGKAVAWAAKNLQKKSVVFVPKDTTALRVKAIQNEGAEVIQLNENYDETCKIANEEATKNNWTLIQDTAWEGYLEIPALIKTGYLTMFKEIEKTLHTEKKANIDVVFLQAGVGSMAAAGIYYYLKKYGANRPKIVIVEPTEADGILLSFKNNKISTSEGNSKTIMAGLNCETPSLGVWELLKNGTDFSIKIDDNYAKKAMKELYFPNNSDKRIISGESGAAGFAGFLSIILDDELNEVKNQLQINKNSNLLFFNTEGDTDPKVFNQIINGTNNI